MLYTDGKVKYIILGSVIDADKRINLTEEKLAKMRAIEWSALPLELAIKTVKGDGSRKLAVFADADCPYCKRLENEFKKVDNVTIYTFLYPIDQLHPDSNQKSKKIWCAADREKAWREWILDGKLPDNDGKCGERRWLPLAHWAPSSTSGHADHRVFERARRAWSAADRALGEGAERLRRRRRSHVGRCGDQGGVEKIAIAGRNQYRTQASRGWSWR